MSQFIESLKVYMADADMETRTQQTEALIDSETLPRSSSSSPPRLFVQPKAAERVG